MLLNSPHGRKLQFDRPRVMGILNITPDSFFDGGKFFVSGKISLKKMLRHAEQLIREGADMLDIGGESTGPGSKDVSAEDELRRILPVIRAVRSSRKHRLKNIWISIDTYKSEVARQAVQAGADMINDVTAFRGDPFMASAVAALRVPILLMYAKDSTPRTTRKKVRYRDVIKTIKTFLGERIRYATRCGILRSRIILDPGMGAFVSGIPQYSFEILRRLPELKKIGFPICVGPSMKSFLGLHKGGNISDRKIPSLFAAWYAAQNGAAIVRMHQPERSFF